MSRVGLILLAFVATFFQDGPSSITGNQPTSTLRGRVWVAERREVPVRRALVTVRISAGSTRSTITDGEGAFSFSGLAAGTVSVTVSKPGSPAVEFGSSRPNRPGTPIVLVAGKETFVNVNLPTGAVISGTIRGPSGEPVPDSPVWVIRSDSVTLQTGNPSAVTDDRGVYRAFGLEAGDYVIATAIASPGIGLMAVLGTTEIDAALARLAGKAGSNGIDGQGRNATYAPIFYPGTPVSSSAAFVSVMPGEERSGIDFGIDLVKTGTIEGTLAGPNDVTANVKIRLLSDHYIRLPYGSTISATTASSSFRFSGVPPGHYRIVATTRSGVGVGGAAGAKPYGAFEDVDVSTDGNVQAVHLELQPAVVLSGRLEFKSSVLRRPATTDIRLTLAEQSSLGPSVLQGDGVLFSRTVSTRGTAEGTFEFNGIFPGTYSLVIEGQSGSWNLESAIVDGVDILDVPPRFTDRSLANVVVTFTDQPSSLSGQMVSKDANSFQALSIVVFSADEELRSSPRRQRLVRPRTDGTFDAGVLPSGRYLVAVVASAESAGVVSDPKSLARLSAASVPVTLEKGERKVITLSIR